MLVVYVGRILPMRTDTEQCRRMWPAHLPRQSGLWRGFFHWHQPAVSFFNATNAFSARSEQSEGGIELVAGQSRMQNLVPVSLKIGRLAAA